MEPRTETNEDWQVGFRAGLAQARDEHEPRIADLEAKLVEAQSLIAKLEAKLAELVERTQRPPKTSRNSSLPPSSDPPSAPKRESKRQTGRKRGAQKGHRGHARQMVDAAQVDEIIDYHPDHCPRCQTILSSELPDMAPSIRHQVWELPKVKASVTEHRQHTVECPECHALVKAAESEMPSEVFGPRATATAGVLHGRWRLSLRETEKVLEVVCGLPISVGGVAGLIRDTSDALEESQFEIARQVRAEPVVNIDETSWRKAGSRPWVWTMVGKKATLFRVLARRNTDSLKDLLGKDYSGTVISDRFSVYKFLSVDKRAICWSHLERDFQSFVDLGEQTREWGKELLGAQQAVFREWHKYRAGQADRAGLLEALKPTQSKMRVLLEKGLSLRQSKGFCLDLLKLWPALWTFAEREGVEPTNNAAEQALRPVVLWRKGCFGAFSDWGNQFVERILSVSATCRQQSLNILDTVTNAVIAWRALATLPQAP
jgi:transposase